jgi:ABC-type uncharacterized transport system substrate-binding protein
MDEPDPMTHHRHPLQILLLAYALLCGSLAKGAGTTILVVESYHAEFAWDASYTQALREDLGSDCRLEFFRMDTKRLPPERHAAMADEAWKRYQDVKPAVVVLGDDAALKFLAPRLAKTGTPVVYLGINNNPRAYYDLALVKNITGVLERPMLKRNIILAQGLVGGLKRVLVLFDTDVTSQVVLAESFDGQDQVTIDGIHVDLKLIGDWDTWKKTVRASKGRYDILVAGLYQTLKDANGKSVDPEEVIRWTSANTPIPPFGFWDFSVGPDKAIGGLVLYGREQGTAAAALVRKILAGASPSSLGPVTGGRGRLLFSRKQLQKHRLTLSPTLGQEATYVD